MDRAQKAEKMELALKKLDETWARVEFQFHQHKDYPVYTTKMAEEDFEARRGRCELEGGRGGEGVRSKKPANLSR